MKCALTAGAEKPWHLAATYFIAATFYRQLIIRHYLSFCSVLRVIVPLPSNDTKYASISFEYRATLVMDTVNEGWDSGADYTPAEFIT